MIKARGIVVTADAEISVREFGEPLYKTLGECVGGYIEHVHPRNLPAPYCMIVDEEFLFKHEASRDALNEIGSFLYQTHLHGHPIFGTIVLMKDILTDDGEDIAGLDDYEIAYLMQLIKKIPIYFKKGSNDND